MSVVALASKTLFYEWRKFLPAALAVAFSGLLLLMQAALMFGIFDSASVYVNKSAADLWAGYPGTQTIELGRPIPRDTEMALRMDPDVVRVEPFDWIDGDWRGPASHGSVSVFISGIDPAPDGLMFAHAIPAAMRALLYEPDGVIVDAADLSKLGLPIGGSATLNGHRVRIVAACNGLRALGGVNIVSSIATARRLNTDSGNPDRVAYYVAKLRPGAKPEVVRDRIEKAWPQRHFTVWTGAEFAHTAATYWMFETGAGLGFVFFTFIVFLVGTVITSQTLMAAVASHVREYAMLNALGAGHGALRRVVLEQALIVGGFGIVAGAVVCAALIALAHSQNVPVAFDASAALGCGALVLAIALVSGAMAVRTIAHLEPANLLR
ncbi:MAG: FtsX-like permease family protein [Xanthomonadaceae bacterium]|nr:FtsX-like permease family protein [Xanthomonadaceae bacterium]MDE1960253.1 FtsX-like permease family protein [Xanthomonadaceae bacterium]MDE2084897.1 FtsX-like permease family protein [Xanthomonadaceae bacterium]MDE2257920.1 FtsX-like permease family protein [Xanthomonadaceae bacterium]